MYPQLAPGSVRRDVSPADLTLIAKDLSQAGQPALPPGPANLGAPARSKLSSIAVSTPIGQPGVLIPLPAPSDFVVETDSTGQRNIYWLGLTRKAR